MLVLSWLDAITDKQHHFRSGLEDLLSIVNCAIVSTTRNSQVDAYVLSESSMFISRRRFILKTCGTTTPLDCIEHLTRLVTEHAKFDTVEVKQFIFVHLYFLGTWYFFGDKYFTTYFRFISGNILFPKKFPTSRSSEASTQEFQRGSKNSREILWCRSW